MPLMIVAGRTFPQGHTTPMLREMKQSNPNGEIDESLRAKYLLLFETAWRSQYLLLKLGIRLQDIECSQRLRGAAFQQGRSDLSGYQSCCISESNQLVRGLSSSSCCIFSRFVLQLRHFPCCSPVRHNAFQRAVCHINSNRISGMFCSHLHIKVHCYRLVRWHGGFLRRKQMVRAIDFRQRNRMQYQRRRRLISCHCVDI